MKFAKLLTTTAIAAAAAATMMSATAARADTTIATIVGAYNLDAYDSPELIFSNLSDGALTNIHITLTGYQGLNAGDTTSFGLADMAAGSTTNVIWGSIPGQPSGTTPGNLTAYDYDDEWGNTPSGFFDPACIIGQGLCSRVGNFSVTVTATIAGGAFDTQSVFSQFSPNNNYTHGFVGWEGLDATGLSETTFDNHSGTFNGTMAVIKLGNPTDFNPNGVPEPASWALMISGFGLAGAALRRRRAIAAA